MSDWEPEDTDWLNRVLPVMILGLVALIIFVAQTKELWLR